MDTGNHGNNTMQLRHLHPDAVKPQQQPTIKRFFMSTSPQKTKTESDNCSLQPVSPSEGHEQPIVTPTGTPMTSHQTAPTSVTQPTTALPVAETHEFTLRKLSEFTLDIDTVTRAELRANAPSAPSTTNEPVQKTQAFVFIPVDISDEDLHKAFQTCAREANKSSSGRRLSETGKTAMRKAIQDFRRIISNPESTVLDVENAEYDMKLLHASIGHLTEPLPANAPPPAPTIAHTPATADAFDLELDLPSPDIQNWMVSVSREPDVPYHYSLMHLTEAAKVLHARAHFGPQSQRDTATAAMHAYMPTNRRMLADTFEARVAELAQPQIAKQLQEKEDSERLASAEKVEHHFTKLRRGHAKNKGSAMNHADNDSMSVSSKGSVSNSMLSLERAFSSVYNIADDPARSLIRTVYISMTSNVSTANIRDVSRQYLLAIITNANSAHNLGNNNVKVAPDYALDLKSPPNRTWTASTGRRLDSKPIAQKGQTTSAGESISMSTTDMPRLSIDSEHKAVPTGMQGIGGDTYYTSASMGDKTEIDPISLSDRGHDTRQGQGCYATHASCASFSSSQENTRLRAWEEYFFPTTDDDALHESTQALRPLFTLPTLGRFTKFPKHRSDVLDGILARLHEAADDYNATLQDLDTARAAGAPPPAAEPALRTGSISDGLAILLRRQLHRYNTLLARAHQTTDMVNSNIPDEDMMKEHNGGLQPLKEIEKAIPLEFTPSGAAMPSDYRTLQPPNTARCLPAVRPDPTVPPGAYAAAHVGLTDQVFDELTRLVPLSHIPPMLDDWESYCSTHDQHGTEHAHDNPLTQQWRRHYGARATSLIEVTPPWVTTIPNIANVTCADAMQLPQVQDRPRPSPTAMWYAAQGQMTRAYVELMTSIDTNGTAYLWVHKEWLRYCTKIDPDEHRTICPHAIAFCKEYATRVTRGETYPWLPGVHVSNTDPLPTPPAPSTRGAAWMEEAIARRDTLDTTASSTGDSEVCTPPTTTTNPTGNHVDEAADDIQFGLDNDARARKADATCRRGDNSHHSKVGPPIRDNKDTNRSGTAAARSADAARTRALMATPSLRLKFRRRKQPPTAAINMFSKTDDTTPSVNRATHDRNLAKMDRYAIECGTVPIPAHQWTGNKGQPYASERHAHPWFPGQDRCSNCHGCHECGTYQQWVVCNQQWSPHHVRLADFYLTRKQGTGVDPTERHSDQIILDIVTRLPPAFLADLSTVNNIMSTHPDRNAPGVRQLTSTISSVYRILTNVGTPAPTPATAASSTPPASAALHEPQGDASTIFAHMRNHARPRAPDLQPPQLTHASLLHVIDRTTRNTSSPTIAEPRSCSPPKRRSAKDIQSELEQLAEQWIDTKAELDDHPASTANTPQRSATNTTAQLPLADTPVTIHSYNGTAAAGARALMSLPDSHTERNILVNPNLIGNPRVMQALTSLMDFGFANSDDDDPAASDYDSDGNDINPHPEPDDDHATFNATALGRTPDRAAVRAPSRPPSPDPTDAGNLHTLESASLPLLAATTTAQVSTSTAANPIAHTVAATVPSQLAPSAAPRVTLASTKSKN
jgi:hypothetical protein